MDKQADSQFPLHDLIKNRWSPRGFSDRSVSEQDVRTLIDAARWAPSCFNEQPWRFLVARKEDGAAYDAMLQCLVGGNQAWAKNAPLLILALASTKFERNGNPNAHAWHDVGLAVGNLTVQALAMDLYVHQMAGIEYDKIRQDYQLPEDVEPVTGLVIGYLGGTEGLPEWAAEKEGAPRERKAAEDIAFKQWGQAY